MISAALKKRTNDAALTVLAGIGWVKDRPKASVSKGQLDTARVELEKCIIELSRLSNGRDTVEAAR
jgi:hypothetical protein